MLDIYTIYDYFIYVGYIYIYNPITLHVVIVRNIIVGDRLTLDFFGVNRD